MIKIEGTITWFCSGENCDFFVEEKISEKNGNKYDSLISDSVVFNMPYQLYNYSVDGEQFHYCKECLEIAKKNFIPKYLKFNSDIKDDSNP